MNRFSALFGRRRLLGGATAVAAATLTGGLTPTRALATARPGGPPSATAVALAQIGLTPQPTPTFTQQTITVVSKKVMRQRTFLVHLPVQPPAQQTPMPAVIVFHGGGQLADAMIPHWEALIAPYDIVIVCPQALVDSTTGRTHWEQAGPGYTSVPTTDLDFVDAILDWLAATGRVDMDRVYASGFSNGAAMTWQLAMLDDFVNRFRGFAPVSHEGYHLAKTALGDPAALQTAKPLIYTHGTADDNWSKVTDDEQQLLPPDAVALWVTRNHTLAAGAPTVYACSTAEQAINPTAIEQLFLPNPIVPNSAAISFITILNGSHCWPLTGNDATGRGLVCRDIDLTKRIIAFWNTYAGMGLPTSPYWRQC